MEIKTSEGQSYTVPVDSMTGSEKQIRKPLQRINIKYFYEKVKQSQKKYGKYSIEWNYAWGWHCRAWNLLKRMNVDHGILKEVSGESKNPYLGLAWYDKKYRSLCEIAGYNVPFFYRTDKG